MPSTKTMVDKAGRLESQTLKPTRQEQLRKLLSRKSGATIAQIANAFNWKTHTVRAAISGLRKAGLVIKRGQGRNGSVYCINHDAGAQ